MTVRVDPHEGVGEVVREVPPVTVNKRINLLDLI